MALSNYHFRSALLLIYANVSLCATLPLSFFSSTACLFCESSVCLNCPQTDGSAFLSFCSNWEQCLFIPIINHSLVVALVCEAIRLLLSGGERENRVTGPAGTECSLAHSPSSPPPWWATLSSSETVSLCNGVLIALIKWDLTSKIGHSPFTSSPCPLLSAGLQLQLFYLTTISATFCWFWQVHYIHCLLLLMLNTVDNIFLYICLSGWHLHCHFVSHLTGHSKHHNLFFIL